MPPKGGDQHDRVGVLQGMPPRPWDAVFDRDEDAAAQAISDSSAGEYWFFRTRDPNIRTYTVICVTPIAYTRRTGALWDQHMDLNHLFPRHLELYDIMEGTYETAVDWATVRLELLQAGFQLMPPDVLASFGEDTPQGPEPLPDDTYEAEPGDELEDGPIRPRRPQPVPGPPSPDTPSVFDRLLDDDDDF